MSFTFNQPTSDLHLDQPPPAASMVQAVNYDRSPSLVDLSATPNTPIPQRVFESFDQADTAYENWLLTCNWPKSPTLKRFWYESEKHLTPGVDYISWGFREHPHWVAVGNGEIVERTEENEELVSGAITLVETIEPGAKPSIIVTAPDNVDMNDLEAKHNTVVDAASDAIDKGLIESIETSNGETVITTTVDEQGQATTVIQPGEGTLATEPAAVPTPTIRLKYTEEEYAELRRRAEEDYAIELQRKENQYAEISMERAKAEDKVKALKAEEKGQLESLRFLKSEGPKYPKNPEIKVPANAGSINGAVTNQEGGSSDQPQPTSSDLDVSDERYQRYRALPLLPIVKDIKGLGSTKLSTLVDQYGTVGALMDMMKEKGLQWYKAVGKGFGPELGTRIEDAVADALEKVE